MKHNGHSFEASPGDYDTFDEELYDLLTGANLPELYAGDPYDWIFMYASGSETPLSCFREILTGDAV